jgi:hypothetical protein
MQFDFPFAGGGPVRLSAVLFPGLCHPSAQPELISLAGKASPVRRGILTSPAGTFPIFRYFRFFGGVLIMKRWTPDEIAKLKDMAQKYPAAKIAEALGRGHSAVFVKAHELKLSLRLKKPADDETRCRRASSVNNVMPRLASLDLLSCRIPDSRYETMEGRIRRAD